MLQKGLSSGLIVPLSQNLSHINTSPGYKHTMPQVMEGTLPIVPKRKGTRIDWSRVKKSMNSKEQG